MSTIALRDMPVAEGRHILIAGSRAIAVKMPDGTDLTYPTEAAAIRGLARLGTALHIPDYISPLRSPSTAAAGSFEDPAAAVGGETPGGDGSSVATSPFRGSTLPAAPVASLGGKPRSARPSRTRSPEASTAVERP